MKVATALAVVLAINVMLFLGQTAVSEIADNYSMETGSDFFTYDNNTMIKNFDTGNYTLDSKVADKLPNNEGSIDPDTGNFFTDLFSTVRQWFLDSTGLTYLIGIATAVPNFLKVIIPITEVAYALGFFWYGLTIFLIVSFIRGGGQL